MISREEKIYLNNEGFAVQDLKYKLFGLTLYKSKSETKEIKVINDFESVKPKKKIGFEK